MDKFELGQPPSDGVSRVVFSAGSSHLLTSSWDKTVRVYDVPTNMLRTRLDLPHPVLDCCYGADGNTAFSASLDGAISSHELSSSGTAVLGKHSAGVKNVKFAPNQNLVVSGSWDKTMALWDPRASDPCVSQHAQPDKVYTMAVAGNRVVVGTALRHIWVWDLRNMKTPDQRRESSLKYQTRVIQPFIDNSRFAVGSIEGRVAVEYFDPSPDEQAKKYAFKCHRRKDDSGKQMVFPVNAIAFHPQHGTFATGGCDGMVCVWDGFRRKRLWQFEKFPTSVASLAFNASGDMLAVASSYTYESGEIDHPSDAIFVQTVTDTHVKPNDI